MSRSARTLLGVVAAVLALGGCSGGEGSSVAATTPAPRATAPTPPPAATSPTPSTVPRVAARCAPADQPVVELTAPDGARLAAIDRGTGTRGVVLGHQSDGGICDLYGFGDQLVAAGYRVLAMDFEGYGRSGTGPRPSGPFVEPYADDLLAGVAHLHAAGVRDVALVGPSMGGTAAVVAAAKAPDQVRAVVDLSGPAQYIGLDSVAAACTSRVPLLMAVSRSDRDVDVTELQAVDAASASPVRQLLVQPGSAHGKQLLATDVQVHDAVLAFLQAQLRP